MRPAKPITAQASPVPGAGGRYVLIDGMDQDAAGRAGEELFGGQAPAGELVSRRTCRLMWDPSKAEPNR